MSEWLQQATHSLEMLKASIETQLSAALPGTSSSAVDLSQFQTSLTSLQHQRELRLILSRTSRLAATNVLFTFANAS